MNNEREMRTFDREDKRKQEQIKQTPTTLPSGIDINMFYRTIGAHDTITPDQRLAFLCFFLYSTGVSMNTICGYVKLTPDTVRMYISRMQITDHDSSLRSYRTIYDTLDLPTTTYPLPPVTRKTETQQTKQGPPTPRAARARVVAQRRKQTRIDASIPIIHADNE